MLWIKALHVVFMVTWFAGLFYLPRLFVYHAAADDRISHERFVVMERKLFAIMTLGAVLTAMFGLWLIVASPGLLSLGWLQAKLVIVTLLAGYHVWCYLLMRDFARERNRRGHVWFRWFNEVPALALIGIVLLAVVKPF